MEKNMQFMTPSPTDGLNDYSQMLQFPDKINCHSKYIRCFKPHSATLRKIWIWKKIKSTSWLSPH